MSALASTDVTVTVNPAERNILGAQGSKNISMGTIAFGDGVKTYPTGGVPMPAIGCFNLKRELQLLVIEQPSANGFVYKYDATNHKIKIFTQGITTGATTVGAAENGALVTKSDGTEGVPRIPHTAASTTYDFGGMIELPATIAPAAASMRVMIVGL